MPARPSPIPASPPKPVGRPALSPGLILAAWFGSGLLRALSATWRLRFLNEQETRQREQARSPFILALWHRDLPGMIRAYRGRGIATLVSWSRDGEIAARAAHHFGVATSRGSTSRAGGAGMLGLLRLARRGRDLAFAPDGPRGPAEAVQPGVLIAAQLLGWPVQPVAVAAERCWRLRSWDRMVIPKPGSRVWIAFGESLAVPKGADLAVLAAELERRLAAAAAAASRAARSR